MQVVLRQLIASTAPNSATVPAGVVVRTRAAEGVVFDGAYLALDERPDGGTDVVVGRAPCATCGGAQRLPGTGGERCPDCTEPPKYSIEATGCALVVEGDGAAALVQRLHAQLDAGKEPTLTWADIRPQVTIRLVRSPEVRRATLRIEGRG